MDATTPPTVLAAPARTAVPAAERVRAHVRDGILDGRYEPGSLLTEGGVADEVGVSRTPVREAMLRLEGDGLLRLYPKRGALVLPVTAGEAQDVFEARELVEGFAAARVWARRDELVPLLAAHLADMRRCRDADDVRGLAESDRAFHAVMVEAAGNAVLTRLYGSLRDRQTCLIVTSARVDPGRKDRAVSEHTEILDALAGTDEERFRALVGAHVRGAAEHLRSVR